MLQGLDTQKLENKTTNDRKTFKYTVEYFNKKKSQMDSVFNQIKPDLMELSKYFSPRSSKFLVTDVNKPIKKSKEIVDSITLTAVGNFVAGMQSGATSAATRWFKNQMKKKELNDIHEVKLWCSKEEELIRKILLSSNFYARMMDIYEDIAVYGFGCLSMESDYENVVNFKHLPVGSYRYSKDYRGEPDTVVRNYMETATNIVEQFGYENCSAEIQQAYDDNRDTMFELVYFVEPNKDYRPNSALAQHKRYIAVTYQPGKKEFIKQSGFDRFPFAIFEAPSNGEDNYPSTCPAIKALPDVKQLMTQVREYSKGIKKLVSPTYRGPASLQKSKGIVDAPSQIIFDDENGQGIKPVYEIKPQILELKQNNDELKQTVKEHFYNDLFAVILNTAERGRTATEVNEVKEEKMVLLSPILDKVHKGLKIIHNWVLYETARIGIMPQPPEVIENEELETEFVSSLALAQKVKGISSIERFTTFVANIATAFDPTALKKVNVDKVIDDYAEIANINPEHIVSTDDVNEQRAELAKQQEQAQQMQALQQGSEMIKNMGGVDAFGANLASRLGVG